jgi:hypothetical protein
MTIRPIRRFVEILGLLDQGRFEDACNQAIAEAFESLQELPTEQGKATVTISIEVAYQAGRVDIVPTLKSKLPVATAFGRTPFWLHEGALSTQHPSQLDIFAVRQVRASEDDVTKQEATNGNK